jgi:hypothetical protein
MQKMTKELFNTSFCLFTAIGQRKNASDKAQHQGIRQKATIFNTSSALFTEHNISNASSKNSTKASTPPPRTRTSTKEHDEKNSLQDFIACSAFLAAKVAESQKRPFDEERGKFCRKLIRKHQRLYCVRLPSSTLSETNTQGKTKKAEKKKKKKKKKN